MQGEYHIYHVVHFIMALFTPVALLENEITRLEHEQTIASAAVDVAGRRTNMADSNLLDIIQNLTALRIAKTRLQSPAPVTPPITP